MTNAFTLYRNKKNIYFLTLKVSRWFYNEIWSHLGSYMRPNHYIEDAEKVKKDLDSQWLFNFFFLNFIIFFIYLYVVVVFFIFIFSNKHLLTMSHVKEENIDVEDLFLPSSGSSRRNAYTQQNFKKIYILVVVNWRHDDAKEGSLYLNTTDAECSLFYI